MWQWQTRGIPGELDIEKGTRAWGRGAAVGGGEEERGLRATESGVLAGGTRRGLGAGMPAQPRFASHPIAPGPHAPGRAWAMTFLMVELRDPADGA